MSLPHMANMSILDIFVQDFKAVQETSCSNILTVQDFEDESINCLHFVYILFTNVIIAAYMLTNENICRQNTSSYVFPEVNRALNNA